MPRTPKEQTVYRFGVSIEPALLNEFDAFVREAGFANRSEAIRELIRARLIGSESEFAEGDVAAILSVFYS
ncbi:MAG: ribbon-helix-helix protein, CopG family, partial [Candidatus Brocadiia bacterium]